MKINHPDRNKVHELDFKQLFNVAKSFTYFKFY